MDTKTFFENFETVADAPGGIARLRELILDLAISGRLLPQIEEEDSSGNLIDELSANRTQALKKRMLATKSAVEVDIEKIPFGIPSNWSWVTLGLFCHPQAGFAFKSNQFNTDGRGMPLIRIRDIGSDSTQCHFEGDFRSEFEVKCGDWLIGMDGNFNVRQWNGPNALLNQRVTRLIFLDQRLEQRFVAWALQKSVYSLMGTKSYTTVDHLSTKQIFESLIPLPPLEEQKRIVAKVDELMALCDQLEAAQQQRDSLRTAARKSAIDSISTASTAEELGAAWKRINQNWRTFADTPESISSLRSLILDLAIRGSLVNQNSADARPQFEQNDGLFEVAPNWIWTSIEKIGTVNPRNSGDDGLEAGFVPMALVSASISSNHKFEVRKWSAIKKGYTHLANGDVAVAKITPCFENGKSCVIQNLPNGIGAGTTELLVVRPNGVLSQYLLIFLKSPFFRNNGIPQMTGTAGQKRLPTGYFKTFPLPLPPVDEQKRIVAKVDELMVLCDQLENLLSERNALSKRIAVALSSEVAA